MTEVDNLWVFGYGSLIWKPGFSYSEKRLAKLTGYRRSFCQASHDHRGTPESPGRVVTLVLDHDSYCEGMAFKIKGQSSGVLGDLDIREQDGYERQIVELLFNDGSSETAVTWIASEGNPSWRAGESFHDVALLISERVGPSGSNREYLYNLHKSLLAVGIQDADIAKLTQQVKALVA